jgi:hypothetical protein
MLTLIDSLSLAGDRRKQNDDAFGAFGRYAWVIDGATDLHGDPLSPAASDASFFAHAFNAALGGAAATAPDLETLLEAGLSGAQAAWASGAEPIAHAWQAPTASVLAAAETPAGLLVTDLGDSRIFILDAGGAAHCFGGGSESAKQESAQVRIITRGQTERPLDRAEVIEELRRRRTLANIPGGYWVLGLDEACLSHRREASFPLTRTAYALLASDGFAALCDRYEAYDPAGLVRAALNQGLAALGEELRAIEDEDQDGARHPRWKKSDDATALLVRLS